MPPRFRSDCRGKRRTVTNPPRGITLRMVRSTSPAAGVWVWGVVALPCASTNRIVELSYSGLREENLPERIVGGVLKRDDGRQSFTNPGLSVQHAAVLGEEVAGLRRENGPLGGTLGVAQLAGLSPVRRDHRGIHVADADHMIGPLLVVQPNAELLGMG